MRRTEQSLIVVDAEAEGGRVWGIRPNSGGADGAFHATFINGKGVGHV